MVSTLAFKVIKNAVKIRLDRGEKLEDIVAVYNKLSKAQSQELLKDFKNYVPQTEEE